MWPAGFPVAQGRRQKVKVMPRNAAFAVREAHGDQRELDGTKERYVSMTVGASSMNERAISSMPEACAAPPRSPWGSSSLVQAPPAYRQVRNALNSSMPLRKGAC